MGLAEGFEVGVLVGQLFEAVVEFDGLSDIRLRRGQVAPLGGITSEIELDEGIFGMERGRLGENLGRGFKRVAPALGKSPGDEPAGLVGVGGGEFGGEDCGIRPFLRPLEKAEFEFQDAAIGSHGRGKVVKLQQGVAHHTEVGITHRTLGVLKIFPKLM